MKLFVAAFVLLIGAYLRLVSLTFPDAVIFDEMHYGFTSSLYSKKEFHFDKQPPLFKILQYMMLPDKFLQSDLWIHVGQQFSSHYNLLIIRLFPALCGVGLIALSYKIILLLRYSRCTAVICALLIACDNGLILQCRLMTADSFQHLLLILCLYHALKNTVASVFVSHFFFACAVSTHWSSSSLFPVVFTLTFLKSWHYFTDVRISLLQALLKGFIYLISCVCLPVVVYFLIIATHITILSHSGPHDSLMSSAFQNSLLGGLKSTSKLVTYGSQLHLRATGDVQLYGTCYLKSTSEVYPVAYSDGRGSSSQQVVSCCHFSSRNSLFEIVAPLDNEKIGSPVQNNDIIHLKHIASGRLLTTHDVAAPISKHRQEVCCFVGQHVHFYPVKFEWKVKILNDINNDFWCNLHSQVLFQHVGTDAYLTVSGISLPSWGKGCDEVVGELPDYADFEPTNWNAEVLYSNMSDETGVSVTQFTIYDKTMEYVYKSLFLEISSSDDHRFASEWSEWLFGSTVIAYWYDKKTSSQIYFIGNVISWVGGLILSIVLVVYFVILTGLHRMKMALIARCHIKRIKFTLFVFGFSYICHLFFYIFSNSRPLFVYQYLPCVIYLHILQACAVEELCSNLNVLFIFATILYLLSVILCCFYFRPLMYGFPNVTKQKLETMKLWETWDFGF